MVLGNGTAILQEGYLWDYQLELGRWHRSQEKAKGQSTDFMSYMINKKWWLEEQFNLHMMRFQQVKMFANQKFYNFYYRLV